MTNKKPATTNNQPNHKSQASQKHNKKADTLLRYQTTHPHKKPATHTQPAPQEQPLQPTAPNHQSQNPATKHHKPERPTPTRTSNQHPGGKKKIYTPTTHTVKPQHRATPHTPQNPTTPTKNPPVTHNTGAELALLRLFD
ncbi:hypothetical protein [Trueperella pyogenes]